LIAIIEPDCDGLFAVLHKPCSLVGALEKIWYCHQTEFRLLVTFVYPLPTAGELKTRADDDDVKTTHGPDGLMPADDSLCEVAAAWLSLSLVSGCEVAEPDHS
jgi:hypothetical protein